MRGHLERLEKPIGGMAAISRCQLGSQRLGGTSVPQCIRPGILPIAFRLKRNMMVDTQEVDVVVVGSGSAALAAALTCSVAGLDTVVLEKTDKIGGTTAISAAGTWVPANHHALAAGIDDTPRDALEYIRALAPPGWWETEDRLWRRFVEEAPRMLAFVEKHTPLRFDLTQQSDPYPDAPGAKRLGRMLSPSPLSRRIVGEYAPYLRRPMLTHMFTYQEFLREDAYHRPLAASSKLLPRLVSRWLTGSRAMGTALVAGFLKGCLDHGCRIGTRARATELILDRKDAICGIVVDQGTSIRRIGVRCGVVLASGGFEWNADLVAKHFPGKVDFITSPWGNEGDGHRMAMSAGAQFAHMDQANLSPALPIRYDGRLQGLSLSFHQEPNAIIVDRKGRRFVDEFRFNIGEVIDQRDPATGEPKHLPAWIVSDRRLLARAPFVRWFANAKKGWMVRADSIAELARRIDLPEVNLTGTIERFNAFCGNGIDEDFGRAAPRQKGKGRANHAALSPIRNCPFLAMPLNRSFISTKGGPRTNEYGEVVRPDGSVIQGLYCAGVAMANPIGTWAVGAGTTIGPNLTWGYSCGQSIKTAGRIGTSAEPKRPQSDALRHRTL